MEQSFVRITIYDMLGNVVNNIFEDMRILVIKLVTWNATNIQGQSVSAGIYLYTLKQGN